MSILARNEQQTENTWDLSTLFSSEESWEKELQELSNAAPSISESRGKLGQSVEQLGKAVEQYLKLSRNLEKLYVYAHLKSDEDTANSNNLGNLQRVSKLYAEFAGHASFFIPELLSIDKSVLTSYLEDEQLAPTRRMLTDILRYKPHTLSDNEENLLALGSEVFGSSGKIFSQLNNADLQFGEIEVDGDAQSLSHSTFQLFLRNKDREIRKKAYHQYYEGFEQHKNTIAAALTGSVKKDVYLARVKKFDSALERSLFSDNVPVEVYSNLIETVSDNLSPLHRYYDLRKKHFTLEESFTYDTYAPLVADVEVHHRYDEAVTVLCESLAPLGEAYVATLREGLTAKRWVDRFENRGKRSGAYSSGCYDSEPYILMNFKENSLNDVYTLTHEAGHSMHSYYSIQNQSYQDYQYTIFVAEVASTFNEQLLTTLFREKYKDDKKMLAHLINHQIDDIKATFYRQTMFAEFERTIHDMDEQNQPLTIDSYRDSYGQLIRKYFGPAINITEIDELECLRIPHFYSAFYVYKYATGLAAAISLSEQVLSGDAQAQERYLNFLKSGGSDYPLILLQKAGVDMTSPEPIQATVQLFDRLVGELEEVLA